MFLFLRPDISTWLTMAECGISPQWGRFVWEKAFWYDPPQSEITHKQQGQGTSRTWADSAAPLSSVEEAFLSSLLHFRWNQFRTQAHFCSLMAKVSS